MYTCLMITSMNNIHPNDPENPSLCLPNVLAIHYSIVSTQKLGLAVPIDTTGTATSVVFSLDGKVCLIWV